MTVVLVDLYPPTHPPTHHHQSPPPLPTIQFKKLDEHLLEAADAALTNGIPQLLRQLGEELDARAAVEKEMHMSFLESGTTANASTVVYSGNEGRMIASRNGDLNAAAAPASGAAATGPIDSQGNPFGSGGSGPGGMAAYASWAALIGKADADSVFRLLPGGQEGLVSGGGARDVLLESGLDTAMLRTIWDLSDIDKDGYLDK